MTTLLERGRRGETLTGLDIIDMHGHLGRYQFAIPDLSPAGLVASMDLIGVRTIVCSHMSCMQGDFERGNRQVLEAMRAYPDRIKGYAALWPSDEQQVAAEMKRCLHDGFVGVKLHNINAFPYTDPAYAPALAMANQRRMPVLLHTWGDEEVISQIRKLAAECPEASLLLAHAGADKLEAYISTAREFENVYLDPCMSAAPRGLMARLVADAGAEKVVWGSDAIFLNMAQQIGRVLGADIPDEDKRKVLSENAGTLLGRIRD